MTYLHLCKNVTFGGAITQNLMHPLDVCSMTYIFFLNFIPSLEHPTMVLNYFVLIKNLAATLGILNK